MKKITVGALIDKPGSSIECKTGGWRAYKPIIDKEKCKKCWLCFDYCPDAAVSKTEDGPVIIYEYCKGCGVCAVECKFEAIEMVPEAK
jgi:pyruvate ferredoxin oxidoreductase delta subunit